MELHGTLNLICLHQVCCNIDLSDSDGIGSADDDCDVVGNDLSWSWQNAGTHNIVFHANDDDGANSSTATVEVLTYLQLSK